MYAINSDICGTKNNGSHKGSMSKYTEWPDLEAEADFFLVLSVESCTISVTVV